jgi:hypothetical protein
MSILDRAKSHFELQGVKKLEVPEWQDDNGKPTLLYCEPVTMSDRKKLRDIANGDEFEFMVRLVILKCQTEDGSKAFDLSDKPTLMTKVDPNIIQRLANQIAAAPSSEEMLGK